MGRLAVPFGVKGWLKVHTFTELADTLADYSEWQIAVQGVWRAYAVIDWKLHSTGLVVQLEGVNDRDAALSLRGCEIAIPRTNLPVAPENEYYWSDLIGMIVQNEQDVVLGEIAEILEAGAHDVLVVKGERERLIPFVEQIVRHVDVPARRVTVDWQPDY
jgi:16S rRNA processing protein RimM